MTWACAFDRFNSQGCVSPMFQVMTSWGSEGIPWVLLFCYHLAYIGLEGPSDAAAGGGGRTGETARETARATARGLREG